MSDVWHDDDYFALFELTPRFTLDMTALSQRYRLLQQAVHPDRFAGQDEQAQRVAVQRATLVNDAFQTLKSPLRRAEYLLAQNGVDISGEQHTLKDTVFLMQQLEWREMLAESNDLDQLDVLRSDVEAARKTLLARLTDVFDVPPVTQPERYADDVRKLRFIEKMLAELDKREDALSFS